MPSESQSFAASLSRKPAIRLSVFALLEACAERPPAWDLLGDLAPEVLRFEQFHVATAYGLALGADPRVVQRRQNHLIRTVVTSILFPLEAFEDRLLVHLDDHGLPALFHHVVREFASDRDSKGVQRILEIGDLCRMASFELEDAILAKADPTDPEGLAEERRAIVDGLLAQVEPEHLQFGWPGIALLWVTSLVDLGGMTDQSTTDHY